MAARPVPRRTGSMGGLWSRNRGSIAQICREHQYQRRNDPEREKRVQRWQDATQFARRADRKPPRDRAGGETCQGRDRARPGRNLQPRAALRTIDIVRARRRFRRRNFRLAMRTHANSHCSPPNANAYNNRNRGIKEREKPEYSSKVSARRRGVRCFLPIKLASVVSEGYWRWREVYHLSRNR
jgi:hypothetical protein